MPIKPLSSPTYYPFATLTKPRQHPGVFLLELHARPDNRLTTAFISETVVPALNDVEREFRASRHNNLEPADPSSSGWLGPKAPGEYALVTCGPRDKNRFYSNGLDLKAAVSTDGFFQHIIGPLYARLLTFPIPTVCAINGHAFAAGFCLALCHDFRVMKEGEAKGRAMMAMNEIEFGSHIPMGLVTLIEAKMPSLEWARKCLTEAHRFGASESLKIGLVDELAPESQVVDAGLALASQKARLAGTAVYGMIKGALYAKNLEVLAVNESGASPTLEDDARIVRLGEAHAGKSKL